MMASLSSSTAAAGVVRQAATKSFRLAPQQQQPIRSSVATFLLRKPHHHQRSLLTTATTPLTSHGSTSSSSSSSAFQQQQSASRTATAAAALLLAAAGTLAVSVAVDPAALEKIPTIVIVPAIVKEKSTGIIFPQLCNGMSLVGCGVRIKWGFVKVYAVGTYMDPIAMSAIKTRPKEEIEKALLDPMYPRTIRLVMARNLSIDKYTNAIVEALEPRMKGQDKEQLEEFKKLNPNVDLVEGAVIEMTIRGDSMLYKNATGGFGAIHSKAFTEAMCDVYYGKDPVSPTHKEDVLKGIPSIK